MQKLQIPKDLWLKFGCFLSGHNYQLLSECSEASKRDIKKITSALVIIAIIWATVGYIFSLKYLNSGWIGGIIGSLFLTVLIVQIERQIILTKSINKKIMFARFLLGFIVAMIGATVVDQYIFKQDIEKIKKDFAAERVTSRIAKGQEFFQNQSSKYDSIIANNEQKISILTAKLNRTPSTITQISARDSETGRPTGYITIPNPAYTQLSDQINNLNRESSTWNTERNSAAKDLNDMINSKQKELIAEEAGFLDELELMIKFLINYKDYGKEYPVALFFYLLWLFFFLLIELSVLILKSSSESNDYEKIIEYQQQIREERLKILEQKRTASLGESFKIELSNHLIDNLPK